MTQTLTLLDVIEVTPDTRHYVFTRPAGYDFKPGQATDMALDRDGWREEKRPFTFTGAPDADSLSFTIKSYPDHDNGVTRELWSLLPGDRVLIGDAWGAIEDKGPGVFLAGGAGITPFVAILRDKARRGDIAGNTLIFSAKTAEGLIHKPLWDRMEGLRRVYAVSEGPAGDHHRGQIDGALLDAALGSDWDQRFYVCGPPPMEEALIEILADRGVPADMIVQED